MSRLSLALALAPLALAACGSPAPAPSEQADATATPGAPAAPTAPAATPAPAAAVTFASLTGDAAAGATVFNQCRACHAVEAGRNGIGPSLHGVVGRTAGTVAGYAYSPANRDSGEVWTPEELFTYLESPLRAIPGTKMTFALTNPQQRADVIAYLGTLR